MKNVLFRIRGFELKVFHGLIGLIAVVIAAIVLLAVGVFVGTHFPYRTLPAPPVPKGQVKPDCSQVNNHTLGECLPQPKGTTRLTGKHASVDLALAAFTTGITGPDLSNNDPVPCGGFAAIARRSTFVYLKSIEGTGFYDGTAASMASCAKRQNLPVGGYDFQHVCQVSAYNEAAFFVRSLRAQGLLGGPKNLRPAGDVEYGNTSCNARGWEQTWVNTVYNLDGHICPIEYTGAWFWQPEFGSWWPTCTNVQLTDWISGYGVSWPYLPSGRTILDLWQNHDNGFNGYSYADLSVWMHDGVSFNSRVGVGVIAPVVDKYAVLPSAYVLIGRSKLSERASVVAFDRHGCAKAKSAECSHLRREIHALERRLVSVASTSKNGWKANNRRKRFYILQRRD